MMEGVQRQLLPTRGGAAVEMGLQEEVLIQQQQRLLWLKLGRTQQVLPVLAVLGRKPRRESRFCTSLAEDSLPWSH